MRVFLTGGTGYIGSAIVESLRRAGHEVASLSRSDQADAALKALGARPIRGALGNVKAVAGQLGEFDALVHAGVDYGLGPTADREAIEALATAARASSRPVTLIYTSGVWVLGTRTAPASEGAALTGIPPAATHRPAHEKVALDAGDERVAGVVIRPGMVSGGKRGLLTPWFAQAETEKRASFVGPGTNRWAVIHRHDLAELYRLVIERRARGIFHGVDGASPTVSELAAAYSRAAGAGGAVRSIPVEEARKSMGAMADALTMDQVVIPARGVEVGWTPRRPPALQDVENLYREYKS